jgi:hypothetical protein
MEGEIEGLIEGLIEIEGLTLSLIDAAMFSIYQ